MIPVHVFTHPTCATCPNAIRLTQKLAEENPKVELRIISLGSARGREIARARQVLSVPTIFVGETRFVGVPTWEELVEAAERK
jgi:glutaredoxin